MHPRYLQWWRILVLLFSIYISSMSYLGCKALGIVINFLYCYYSLFYTPALADGLSLESPGLYLVFWPILIILLVWGSLLIVLFPIFQDLLPSLSFWMHDWYHRYFHVLFFISRATSKYSSLFSFSLIFTMWWQSLQFGKLFAFLLFFFFTITQSGLLDRWCVCTERYRATGVRIRFYQVVVLYVGHCTVGTLSKEKIKFYNLKFKLKHFVSKLSLL